jgi:NAD(P)-dependent dehydrogenase (short-subunit alcohol dehydrogenase family)
MTSKAGLKDQHVVIIGGSSGIGLATARAALDAGARVTIAARDEDRLKAAAAELGGDTGIAPVDVTKEGEISETFTSLGPVDHVLLSAGAPMFGAFDKLNIEQVRRYWDTHLGSLLTVARHGTAKISTGGSVVFITSTQNRRAATPGAIPAAVVGHSVEVLTAHLALELGPQGVRVNAVACGFVETPLTTRALGDRLTARIADLTRLLPIGRLVRPDEVAALVVHLFENGAITGAITAIDGGQSLT